MSRQLLDTVAAGVALLGAFLPGAVAADPSAKPNFVIILMDDMGYGDIGPFNPKAKNKTPNLERRAEPPCAPAPD